MAGTKGQTDSGYRERNSTADRALDVLGLFREDKLVWSGAEIAEQLGVARSTGYRYLQSLVGSGFLEETSGGFRLGPRVFELARLARKGVGLSELALPVMRDLVAEIGETALLTRRSGASAVCLEVVEPPHPVRLSYERGHVLPLNAGASAQVLIAWEPEERLAELLATVELLRFTDSTITDPEQFRQRLAEIRKAGTAVTYHELDEGVVGVAAPIRDAADTVVAAISIAAVASRVPRAQVRGLRQAVREAAELVSERLTASQG